MYQNRYRLELVECKCGCGETLFDRDDRGRLREYIKGHWNRGRKKDANHLLRGEQHWSWKGGRRRSNGYILLLRPDHPQADRDGYIEEHRVEYEGYHKCCLLPWAQIHHKDGNKQNNTKNNLILTSIWEHRGKFHKEDFGQVCERCINVKRHGFSKLGKQMFICNNCELNWTINRRRNVDYGQICLNCNSRHVKSGGVTRRKQYFRCKSCKEWWTIPLQELKKVVSENDRHYRIGRGR